MPCLYVSLVDERRRVSFLAWCPTFANGSVGATLAVALLWEVARIQIPLLGGVRALLVVK